MPKMFWNSHPTIWLWTDSHSARLKSHALSLGTEEFRSTSPERTKSKIRLLRRVNELVDRRRPSVLTSERLKAAFKLWSKLQRTPAPESAKKAPKLQKQTRLSKAQSRWLVKEYQEGKTIAQLTKIYNVHRTTVSIHLENAGVPRRVFRRKMTDARVREAARLHAEGASLAELGRKFGVDPATIKKELKGNLFT
jgi:Helix-turn-helix domain